MLSHACMYGFVHVHKELPFRRHAPSGPTRAQIDSYIFPLARSVDRDNNKQGSMQDAAAEDSSWCMVYFSRKKLKGGKKSIKNLYPKVLALGLKIAQQLLNFQGVRFMVMYAVAHKVVTVFYRTKQILYMNSFPLGNLPKKMMNEPFK